MTTETLKSKLLQKQSALNAELAKYDNRQHLPRKLFFHALTHQVRNYRKISAIDMVIEMLSSEEWWNLNLSKYVTLCIADTRMDKTDLEINARSIYLNTRKQVVKEIISTSLPICKKEAIALLN